MNLAAKARREIERTEIASEGLDRRPHLSAECHRPEPLAEAAFHGLAGDVVRTIEPHTEADTAALLIQFLVFVGTCIGRNAYYLVEGDKHFANLFTVLVGETGKGRKGTSMGRIRQIFEMIDDPFSGRCIQSGLSSGEGLIHAVRDDTDNDAGVEDKRLLVAESEFAGLLKVMHREGNIISRIIRDAWDRGDLGVMTKNCPTRASNAHVSIIGHITKPELTRYLDRTEAANGFANRFLFITVKRSKCLPFGGTLADRDLNPLAKRLAEVIGHDKLPRRVDMNYAAKQLWEQVYPDLSEGQSGLYGAVTGRAEAQVVRLALIYALLDMQPEISTDHLRAALAVWDYADDSAIYIFGDATGDPVKDTILSALKNNPDGLSRTEISRLFKGHQKSKRIRRVLEELKKLGRIEKEAIETDGRSAEVWKCT